MTDVLSPERVILDPVEFTEEPESFARQTLKRLMRHRLAIAGLIIFVLLQFFFWVGPSFSAQTFDEINVLNRAQGPSGDHWFGTDDLGRDLFVRAMIGGRFSMQIALVAALLSTVLGAILGGVAGYFSGPTDTAVSFAINLLLTMPGIAILAVVGIRFGSSPLTLALILSLLGWVRAGRIVRAQILKFKEYEFVLAARAAGASPLRILRRHLLPNVLGALLVEITLVVGGVIIIESTLSFLSLGVQPPETTLGTLINDGRGSIDTRPSRVLIPGGIVTLIVLSINFIGDGLRDALDPTQEI